MREKRKSGTVSGLVLIELFLAVQINVPIHPDHDLGVFQFAANVAVPVHRRLVNTAADHPGGKGEPDFVFAEKTVYLLQINIFRSALANDDHRLGQRFAFLFAHCFRYKERECLKNGRSDTVS